MTFKNYQLPWFAIQVRTCREKNTSLFLEKMGYEHFLPVSKCIHRWSDRMKQIEEPLFPGYLFCRMSPNHRLPVLSAPGVIQIVSVGKVPIPVEEEEVEGIRRAVENGLTVTPSPYLQVGDVAQIVQGPLRGLTGIILRTNSQLKLVLSVNLLQRSVAVEVDRAWVSVTGPARVELVPAKTVGQFV